MRLGSSPKYSRLAPERAFERLGPAKALRENLVERVVPRRRRRRQLPQRMGELGHGARVARLADRPQQIVDALHVGQKLLDRRPLVGKALGQRVIGGVEAGGQREALADGTAAHMMQRAGRQPFDLVENAEIPEDRVLHVARIARVGGLVQRGFDGEPADAVNRSRPAEAEIALQQADAVAGLGQQRPRREPAKPGTDHHGVEFFDLSHFRPNSPRGPA